MFYYLTLITACWLNGVTYFCHSESFKLKQNLMTLGLQVWNKLNVATICMNHEQPLTQFSNIICHFEKAQTPSFPVRHTTPPPDTHILSAYSLVYLTVKRGLWVCCKGRIVCRFNPLPPHSTTSTPCISIFFKMCGMYIRNCRDVVAAVSGKTRVDSYDCSCGLGYSFNEGWGELQDILVLCHADVACRDGWIVLSTTMDCTLSNTKRQPDGIPLLSQVINCPHIK